MQFRNIRVDAGSTRIDEIVDGIYRISTWQGPYGITFNQFLIADERPALIHTGMHHLYEPIRRVIGEVLDPTKLSCVVLLHWEGDENGGMDRFMKAAPQCELIGSLLSIQLNASGFGVTERVRGFRDGETLTLRSTSTPPATRRSGLCHAPGSIATRSRKRASVRWRK